MRALRIISLLALSIALVVFVFSCSDSGTNGNGNDDEGPSLTLTADSYNIIADGTSSTTVHATVKDSTGANVSDGTTVNFTTSLGTITPSATTSSGVANATLTSSSTAGTATVIATCGDVADTIQVEFREATASLTLTADSSSIVANGTSSTAVHATVTDSTGNFVANGTTVNFTTSLGTITPSATTSSGVANGTLTSSTTEGTATVIATCGVLADTIQVEFREASSGPDLFFLGGNLGIMTFSDGSFQLWISRLQGTTGADEATVTLNGTNVPLQTFISTEEDAFYVLNHIGYETEKAYSVVVNIGGETATCNLTTSGASFAKITAPVDESEYTPGEPLTIEWEYEGSGYPDSIDITVCDNYYGSEPDSEEYDSGHKSPARTPAIRFRGR